MEMPNITTTLRIEELNFTLRVKAYKKLTDAELRQVLAVWMRQTRRKKVPRNKDVEINSIHGYSPADCL